MSDDVDGRVLPGMNALTLVMLWMSTVAITTVSSPGAAAADAAPRVAAGKAAFSACASCHAVGPSARNGFGPQLNGIVGRRAGVTAGYAYSAEMKNSKIVWMESALAAFIKDPSGTVPGTKMRFLSLGFGDQKIADLLAYLRTLPATE